MEKPKSRVTSSHQRQLEDENDDDDELQKLPARDSASEMMP